MLSSKSISGGDILPRYVFAISPGIKLAYVFGEEDSFTYGFELAVSYFDFNNLANFGGNLSIDINKNYSKLHLGVEVILPILAVDFGPTLLFDKVKGRTHLGYSISPFLTGIVFIPTFSYSNFSNYKSLYELGMIFKYPIFRDDKQVWHFIGK